MVTEISDWNELSSAIEGSNGSNDTGDYKLVANLDEDTAGYDGIGNSWTPPGNHDFDSGFGGTFDGNGYAIRDLIIPETEFDEGPIGFIGDTINVGDVTITDLTVEGEIVTSQSISSVGIIVGTFAQADVLERCVAAGKIDAPSCQEVGGLVGRGSNAVDPSEINDSYSFVDVTGDDTVGGFIGYNSTTVRRSYAAGPVSGNIDVGGFVSRSETEVDCYYDTEATGQTGSNGGATPLTTSEMQGSSASSNLSGFDFSNVWKTVIGGSNSDIDAYPYLRALSVHEQSDFQEARFEPFSITVAGTNSPVNADDELTVDVEVTNDGDFEGDAEIDLIIEET